LSTSEIRQRLPILLSDLGARSLLDAPCDDFNWMQKVRLGLDEYIGVDIIPQLIAHNRERFANAGRKFVCIDIAGEALPQVDVIFCRDCLVYLPYVDIFRVLRNFKCSKSTYLLATTFVNRTKTPTSRRVPGVR